jgi:hypothetical protein
VTQNTVMMLQRKHITHTVHDVCSTGVSGQLGSRIVKELLQNGVSVVAGTVSQGYAPLQNCCVAIFGDANILHRLHLAGVPEDDPADDALDFALQFELIKKAEAKSLSIQQVDFADADSFGIPRCGRSLDPVMHSASASAHSGMSGMI